MREEITNSHDTWNNVRIHTDRSLSCGVNSFHWIHCIVFLVIGNSTMVKRDRIRVEAFQILESESERLTANPILARDSEWTVVSGIDSFCLRSEVLDTAKLRHIADSTGLSALEADRLLKRPFEAHISLSSISPTPFTTDEFFLVGGVMHVAP